MNIVLNADLKETNALLLRLVLAVEYAAGIGPPATGAEPVADPDNPAVTYSSESELLREEWRIKNGLPSDETPV